MVAIATSPKSLLTNGPRDAVRQFDLNVVHLIAQSLPDRVDIADLVREIDVDDKQSLAGQGANVLDFGKLAEFPLDRNGDQIFQRSGASPGNCADTTAVRITTTGSSRLGKFG